MTITSVIVDAVLRPDASEERGERASGFRFGGGDPGRERQLVDVGAGDQAGEFGEQRGVREDRRRQEAGGGFAGGGVAVVSEVRGQGVREPGVDVGLDVAAGSPVSSSRAASSPSRGSICSSVPSSRSAWSSSARAAIRAASRSSASRAAAAASAASSAWTKSSASGS